MNYKEKYHKYKNKYLNLKQKAGAETNYVISLLWFNKKLGPIQQISNGKDLQIKEKIISTYNMFKHKYRNDNVILFLNYDKIIPKDFDFFAENNIVTYDINTFNTINNNDKLLELFRSEKLPVYIYVDMLKIIIQYEFMVYKNFDYVIFSDLDIQDKDSLNHNDMICNNYMSDYIDEYYPEKIFNDVTVELLDIFGYLMASYRKISMDELTPRDKQGIEFDLENYGFTERAMVIDGKQRLIGKFSPENSFLISKNNFNTIKAIKDFFIDYLFCTELYDSLMRYIKRGINSDVILLSNDYIYNQYTRFYLYLNFLNNINTIIIGQNKNMKKINKKDFFIEDGYVILKSSEPIDLLKDENPLLLSEIKINIDSITDIGKSIYKKYYYNIFKQTYNQVSLIPSICVPIGSQKNSK